jgi:hypothetical protein
MAADPAFWPLTTDSLSEGAVEGLAGGTPLAGLRKLSDSCEALALISRGSTPGLLETLSAGCEPLVKGLAKGLANELLP